MKYRVKISRWDVDPRYEHIEARNDIEAREIFTKEYKNNFSHSWNDLSLEKVIQTEKTVILDRSK
jgi:hypothetical protein